MARKPSEPKASPKKERPPSKPPAPLPHDLPMFPENAPLDEKGEPVVRP